MKKRSPKLQAKFDAEVKSIKAQFDLTNRSRKKEGKSQVQTCYGGSWAHEQDFDKRHPDVSRNGSKRKPVKPANAKPTIPLSTFVKNHKEDIDNRVHRLIPGLRMNDRERALWLRNDSGINRWAKSLGCDFSAA